MFVSGLALLSAALLGRGAQAARVSSSQQEEWPAFYGMFGSYTRRHDGGSTEKSKETQAAEAQEREYAGSINDVAMICGGPEIWKMLTASSSVTGVQNVPWAKMEAVKADRVREREMKVQELELEVQGLATLVAEKEAEQRVAHASAEQSRQLIAAALGPDSFGALDVAQRSGCGSVRGGTIRAPRQAFRKSEGLFETAAAAFFEGARFRLDGDAFLATCGELLPQESDRSYCAQLCQRFKDTAQRLSDGAAGETTGNLDELLKKREEKAGALAAARTHIAECTRAWDGISVLRRHIEELKAGLDARFRVLQDAEMALDDAQWELTDIEDNLKEEEELLSQALESVASAGAQVGERGVRSRELMSKELNVRASLESLEKQLQTGRARFEAAKTADKAVVDLKTAVSTVMVKMELFYKSAVAEPLSNLGLDADLNLEDPGVFPSDPAATSTGGLLKSSVDELRAFCSGAALPAFQAVREQVELSPLCAMDEPASIMAGLNEAVLSRMGHIKKDLLWVKSWLNPYRDNAEMTAERAKELVEKGEPKGFQEIVSVYHQTEFFKYLRDWRHGGPHLELLARLGEMTRALEDSVRQTDAQLESLKVEMAETATVRERAVVELEELIDQAGLEQTRKEEAEDRVMELREGAARMALELEELEGAVQKAREAYDAAAVKLVTAHQEGVAALSFSVNSFAELEAQSKEAELLVSLIERSLATAELSHTESQARLAKLQK